MPKIKLSQSVVDSIANSPKRVNYYDANCKYLVYRVSATGGNFYHARKINGVLKYIKLNARTYREALLENARCLAAPSNVTPEHNTLGAMFEDFMAHKRNRGDTEKGIANARQRFRDHIPVLNNLASSAVANAIFISYIVCLKNGISS